MYLYDVTTVLRTLANRVIPISSLFLEFFEKAVYIKWKVFEWTVNWIVFLRRRPPLGRETWNLFQKIKRELPSL